MADEYQIPAVRDACEERMAKSVADMPMSHRFPGEGDHTLISNANKALDLIMFSSLYNLNMLLKSASESISRVPMGELTSLIKYKKLPEYCKIEILSARLERCDKKLFYKPGVKGENEKISTMVQCDILPTPEPPARPWNGGVSAQQPTNQNGGILQPANQNAMNYFYD